VDVVACRAKAHEELGEYNLALADASMALALEEHAAVALQDSPRVIEEEERKMAAAVVVAAAAAARKDATGEGARGSACASARAPRIASCKAHVAKYKQLLRLQDHKDSSLFRKMLGNMSEKS
jgi:hypothetical protein